MAALLLFYLVAVSFRITKKEFFAIATMAMVGGCLAAGYAAFGFYHGGAYQTHQGQRASLVVADNALDPNYFAASLLLPMSLAIAGLLSSRSLLKRVAFLSVVLLLAYALLLSMSRGALLAVFAMMFVYFRSLRLKKALLVVIFVFIIAAAGVPERFYSRLQTASATRGAGRLDIWMVGWAAAKDHGIIGAGLGNFPIVYDNYKGAGEFFRGVTRAPHNIYLEVWVELGLIGLFLFALALISQLRETKASQPAMSGAPTKLAFYGVACEAACWGLLANGFFLGILWFKMFWLCWIFLALMVKLLRSSHIDSQHTA
jgi:O-antigen ligase